MNQHDELITNKRSWWKRTVPVRVRHNSRLILGSVLVLLITGIVLGSFRIDPIIFTQGSQEQATNSRFNIIGNTDLFDLSVPHKVDMLISPARYHN